MCKILNIKFIGRKYFINIQKIAKNFTEFIIKTSNENENETNPMKLNEEINQLKIELKQEKEKNKELYDENLKLKEEIKGMKNGKESNSLKEGEELNIIFEFPDKNLEKYSLKCHNNELFVFVEKKLYEKYPQFRDKDVYFMDKENKIKRFQTLEENKIKNNDILILKEYNF